jgi:hypothetical protein
MEIETGQVWVRKYGTGYGEDQITILADVSTPDDEYERWEVQYGDGKTLKLLTPYIQSMFEYKNEHPKSVRFTDLNRDVLSAHTGHNDPANVIFHTTGGTSVVLRPDDIDALMLWLKGHRHIYRNA